MSDLHFEIVNHGDVVEVAAVVVVVVVAVDETTGLWTFLLSPRAVVAAVGHAPVAAVHELPDSLQPLANAGQFVH